MTLSALNDMELHAEYRVACEELFWQVDAVVVRDSRILDNTDHEKAWFYETEKAWERVKEVHKEARRRFGDDNRGDAGL